MLMRNIYFMKKLPNKVKVVAHLHI